MKDLTTTSPNNYETGNLPKIFLRSFENVGPERHGPTGSRANRHRAVCIASEHRAVIKDMSGRTKQLVTFGVIRVDTPG